MPLINKLDDTKLRSVGYGKDKPYITTDVVTGKVDTGKVPLVDTVLNLIPKQINLLGNKVDIVNSKPIHGVVDAARIGGFLLDLNKGPEFVVKQVALQKMNVIPNGGNSTILSNPFAGSTSFFGKIGKALVNTVNKLAPYPGQLYSPTNTVAQIALQGVGLNIGRAGLFPALDVPKYENFFGDKGNTFSDTNSNILKLYEKQPQHSSKLLNKIQGILSGIPILKRAIPLPGIGSRTLYSYTGGPESLGGFGITNIDRGEIRKGIFTINDSINASSTAFKNTWTMYSKTDALINAYSERLADGRVGTYIKRSKFQPSVSNPKFLKKSNSYKDATGFATYDSSIKELTYNNNFDKPLTFTVKGNIANISRELRIGSGRKDAINMTPLFSGSTADNNSLINIDGKRYNLRDLIKFRIETVDNDSNGSVFMVFRSYLTDFSDSINGEWNSFKYVGRGENLYTYSGFSRSVSIGFKVAALSEMEMQPMYQKLNYLASSIMPDYTGEYMKGNFFKMTIGNYFYRQIGIITSLTYKISNDTPWEIAMDEPEGGRSETNKLYELPHIIDVNLTFIPIGLQNNGNNQIPQKGVNSPVMLQGDKNPWVNGVKIGKGAGEGFNNNYVGSDVERPRERLKAEIIRAERPNINQIQPIEKILPTTVPVILPASAAPSPDVNPQWHPLSGDGSDPFDPNFNG